MTSKNALPKESSLAAEDLNKEDIGAIHFSVTKDGYFRCGEAEDKYGNDCSFRRYMTLLSLARHWQAHHYHTIKGIGAINWDTNE